MISDHIIFAGVELASGRKPVLFAALDTELRILTLEKWSIDKTIACLQDYPAVVLGVGSPRLKSSENVFVEFRKRLARAGFSPFSSKEAHRWLETDPQQCYLALCAHQLLPRRALEGRIQRALILYEEGFQINDPMEFFEEITRHKFMQGVLPLENLHSARELDALVAAFVAWISVRRAGLVKIDGNFILPARA